MRQVGSVVFWLFVVISSIPLTAIAFCDLACHDAVRQTPRRPSPLHVFLGVALHLDEPRLASHHHGS